MRGMLRCSACDALCGVRRFPSHCEATSLFVACCGAPQLAMGNRCDAPCNCSQRWVEAARKEGLREISEYADDKNEDHEEVVHWSLSINGVSKKRKTMVDIDTFHGACGHMQKTVVDMDTILEEIGNLPTVDMEILRESDKIFNPPALEGLHLPIPALQRNAYTQSRSGKEALSPNMRQRFSPASSWHSSQACGPLSDRSSPASFGFAATSRSRSQSPGSPYQISSYALLDALVGAPLSQLNRRSSSRPRSRTCSSRKKSPGSERPGSRHITFKNSPCHSVHMSEYSIPPYSEVYGQHPRLFDFDAAGEMIPREEVDFNFEFESHQDRIVYRWGQPGKAVKIRPGSRIQEFTFSGPAGAICFD